MDKAAVSFDIFIFTSTVTVATADTDRTYMIVLSSLMLNLVTGLVLC